MRTEIDDDLLDKQIARLVKNPDVQRAMRLRCEQEGHDMQNGIALSIGSPMMRVVRICRWCGEGKP